MGVRLQPPGIPSPPCSPCLCRGTSSAAALTDNRGGLSVEAGVKVCSGRKAECRISGRTIGTRAGAAWPWTVRAILPHGLPPPAHPPAITGTDSQRSAVRRLSICRRARFLRGNGGTLVLLAGTRPVLGRAGQAPEAPLLAAPPRCVADKCKKTPIPTQQIGSRSSSLSLVDDKPLSEGQRQLAARPQPPLGLHPRRRPHVDDAVACGGLAAGGEGARYGCCGCCSCLACHKLCTSPIPHAAPRMPRNARCSTIPPAPAASQYPPPAHPPGTGIRRR